MTSPILQLQIGPNKKCSETINFDLVSKVNILIGENGCGKSAILEKIFLDQLEKESLFDDFDLRENADSDDYEDYEENYSYIKAKSPIKKQKVIVFSSGMNENYSKHLNTQLYHLSDLYSQNYEYLVKNVFLGSYYFNSYRGKLLIFLAYSLYENGLTNKFLRKYSKGGSLEIGLNINIDQTYIDQLNFSIGEIKGLISSFYHTKLGDIINSMLTTSKYYTRANEIDYDFETPLNTFGYIDGEDIYDLFYKKSDELITFFGIFFLKNSDIKSTKLKILKELEIEDISDGEFQMCIVYSLLDLFDNENTLFLLDEIDSHLHYDKINEIWTTLNNIKGKLIATTHIPDSIINNSFESIKLVENGKIQKNGNQANEIIKRLGNLSEKTYYEKKYASKIKYIALVEDETDWVIFSELIKNKLGDDAYNRLNKIQFIKCGSGYDKHTESFGNNKKKRIQEFNDITGRNIETENIFCICDRDNLPINSINTTNGVKVDGENNTKFGNNKTSYILSRKRKQIENYLLSYTLLDIYGLLEHINNDNLAKNFHLKKDNSGDNAGIQNLEVKDIIKTLYSTEGIGVDYQKLQEIISKIPPTEIGEDITNMYNFIVGNID